MNLSEKDLKRTIDIKDRLDIMVTEEEMGTIESDLEELSLKLIQLLKECRDKGLLTDTEYENHTKVKNTFLNYLKEKRKISTL